jgi:hypothetical protein
LLKYSHASPASATSSGSGGSSGSSDNATVDLKIKGVYDMRCIRAVVYETNLGEGGGAGGAEVAGGAGGRLAIISSSASLDMDSPSRGGRSPNVTDSAVFELQFWKNGRFWGDLTGDVSCSSGGSGDISSESLPSLRLRASDSDDAVRWVQAIMAVTKQVNRYIYRNTILHQ